MVDDNSTLQSTSSYRTVHLPYDWDSESTTTRDSRLGSVESGLYVRTETSFTHGSIPPIAFGSSDERVQISSQQICAHEINNEKGKGMNNISNLGNTFTSVGESQYKSAEEQQITPNHIIAEAYVETKSAFRSEERKEYCSNVKGADAMKAESTARHCVNEFTSEKSTQTVPLEDQEVTTRDINVVMTSQNRSEPVTEERRTAEISTTPQDIDRIVMCSQAVQDAEPSGVEKGGEFTDDAEEQLQDGFSFKEEWTKQLVGNFCIKHPKIRLCWSITRTLFLMINFVFVLLILPYMAVGLAFIMGAYPEISVKVLYVLEATIICGYIVYNPVVCYRDVHKQEKLK